MATKYETVADIIAERDQLRSYCDALNTRCIADAQDAERYRHAKAHGWPISGPQCIAWTHEGRMILADTPEEALDAAMAARGIGAA